MTLALPSDAAEVHPLKGARVLVVGASSGIGRAFAVAAAEQGAQVAVAARRMDRLTSLAEQIGGTAYELDVTDPFAIARVVAETADALGGFDVLMCTTGVLPFAHIEHINPVTWAEAFAVNTVGPTLVIGAALPYLSDRSVVVVATSDENRRTRAGTAAYSASKAALDDILQSWRCEHPHLRVQRVAIGPTVGTEILRGADDQLLAELMETWAAQGQIPAELADVADVAAELVGLVNAALENERLLIENVHVAIRPRVARVPSRCSANREETNHAGCARA